MSADDRLPPLTGLPGAAVGYACILLVSYLTAAAAFTALLPEQPRLVLLLAQLLGLLVPALLLMRLLRALGFRFAVAGTRSDALRFGGVPLAIVAVAGFVAAQCILLGWLRLLLLLDEDLVRQLAELASQAYAPLLSGEGPAAIAQVFVIACVLPAACEELAFRRGLQGLLASRLPAALAIGLTASCFSLFHLELLGLPTRLFLGVSLGLVYHWTGSLLAAGLLHGLHNALALSTLLFGEEPAELTSVGPLDAVARLDLAPVLLTGLGAGLAWALAIRALRPVPAVAEPTDG